MDQENKIAPLVEAYIPDATEAEKIALTKELRTLCAALYDSFMQAERFDAMAGSMVDSESSSPHNL